MLRRGPLHCVHQQLGARLVEFGGWEMPLHYTGIMEEHLAVRRAAGLFDISHMGEVSVSGSGALKFLNGVLTNDLARLDVGQGQYTLLTNERGGAVDDLYAYRLEAQNYLLVINASRIEADLAWLRVQLAGHQGPELVLEDRSDQTGALAVQGPAVASFIDRPFAGPAVGGTLAPKPSALRKNQLSSFAFAGSAIWVARTGYTGEDGFELLAPAALIESLWSVLVEDGRSVGLTPCGLGARDTLRTEMGYPLYGHELDETRSPLEAGLGAFVALGKGPFTGRDLLVAEKEIGTVRRCVAFRMSRPGPPPRPGYPIASPQTGGAPVGEVTSGTLSPSLGIGIGLGYVPTALGQPGTPIEIEIRGRRHPAVVAAKPLYQKPV
jgi:aminomethyltransferase